MNHRSLRVEQCVAAVLFTLALLSLGPAACGPGNGGSELDAAVDAGHGGHDSGRDAGHSDAGERDSGSRDSGATDAGSADAALADAGPSDAGERDAGSRDAAASDAGSADAALADAGSADAGSADAGPLDEHGFTIRRPMLRTVPCEAPMCPAPTSNARDEDYLCTFKHGSINGFLYSQATPVRDMIMAGLEYETVGTWVSVDGHATPVKGSYDLGGNHRNDSITFTYAGQDYRYYHSSFSVGWRACQPMDCIQLLTGDAVTEDGCGPSRSLPVICVRVADDGTTPPLVDKFSKCPGDPNAKSGQ